MTQVLKNIDLIDCFGSNYNLSDEAYEVLDSLMITELKNLYKKNPIEKEKINLKDDK